MLRIKTFLLILLLVVLVFYHGCVVNAERNQEARLYGQYKDGVVTEQEYKKEKEKITYFSTFFNFKESLTAFDTSAEPCPALWFDFVLRLRLVRLRPSVYSGLHLPQAGQASPFLWFDSALRLRLVRLRPSVYSGLHPSTYSGLRSPQAGQASPFLWFDSALRQAQGRLHHSERSRGRTIPSGVEGQGGEKSEAQYSAQGTPGSCPERSRRISPGGLH